MEVRELVILGATPGDVAAAIVSTSVAVPVPYWFEAEIEMFVVPAVVGVPVMIPVPVLIERPAGRPVAL